MKSLNKLVVALISLSIFSNCYSQLSINQYGRYDSIVVLNQFNDTMHNAWVGGLNNPNFSHIDINQDQLPDIFVFDKDHNSSRVFLNTGVKGEKTWKYNFPYQTKIPQIENWALLKDYNHDLKADLFTFHNRGIKLYKNVSQSGKANDIKFQLLRFPAGAGASITKETYITSQIKSGSTWYLGNVHNEWNNIPAITDVDQDGDLDILAFGQSNPSISLYRNLSKGIDPFADSLRFKIDSNQCWGYFDERADFKLDFNSCQGMPVPPKVRKRHGGTNVLVYDFDCNSSPDILMGDISFSRMLMGFNHGSALKPRIKSQDTSYPSIDIPINVEGFPASYLIDADNDGDLDLLAAPNAANSFKNINQIAYYRNTGTDLCMKLEKHSDDFLVNSILDFGTSAFPVLVDVNGDSLLDILVGGYGVYTPSGVYESRIAYLKNIGSKTNPAFKLISKDYLSLPFSNIKGLYPSIGDLDNDGDNDLILGTDSGLVFYYRNIADSPSDSLKLVYDQTSWSNTQFGKSIRPFLFDVNGDGLLDLLIGSQTNNIQFVPNTGSKNTPEFLVSNSVANWKGIKHEDGIKNGNISIWISDLDSYGKYSTTGERTIFVGSSTGSLFRYSGLKNDGSGSVTLKDQLYLYSLNASIAFADITGDNKPDFVYGQKSGGLSVLLKDGGSIITPPPPIDNTNLNDFKAKKLEYKIYPNPAFNSLMVKVTNKQNNEKIQLKIVDLNGKVLIQQNSNLNLIPLNISSLSRGTYWLYLQTKKQVEVKSIIKL